MFGNIVGIDMDGAAVHLVRMAGGEIKDVSSLQVPEGAGEAPFIRALRQAGISGCRGAVVLPENGVVTQNMVLPELSARQLAFHLPFEMNDYLPRSREDYCFAGAVSDCQPAPGKMEVFACGAEKKAVYRCRKLLRQAGAGLRAALPEQWAYVSLLQSLDIQESICLVDIGQNDTHIHVFSQGWPRLRRVLAGGCREPEEWQQLALEILKTTHFYNSGHRDYPLQGIYLCGEGAVREGLHKCLEEHLELPVLSLGDLSPALEGMEVYAKALGCAAYASRSGKLLNFARQREPVAWASLALGLLLSGLVLFGAVQLGVLLPLARLEEARLTWQQTADRTQQLQNALADFTEIQEEYQQQMVVPDTEDWAVLLEITAREISARGALHSLACQDGQLQVQVSGLTLGEMAELCETLEQWPQVARAVVDTAQAGQVFSMTIHLENKEVGA